MSFFTTNTNGKNSKSIYNPEVFSQVRFFNSSSQVDNTSLSFSFWNGLLKVSINPIIVNNGSANRVDKDNAVSIYLSPLKASILLKFAKEFRDDPKKYMNSGINTNKGIIYLTDGKDEFNQESKFLVIKIIDATTGDCKSQAAYEFNKSDHFGIINYTNKNNFTRYYDGADIVELNMFINVLDSYIKSATSAYAASVMEANKFDSTRTFNSLREIKEKLGIKYEGKNNNGEVNKPSYFNLSQGNSQPTSNNYSKVENIDDYDALVRDLEAMGED